MINTGPKGIEIRRFDPADLEQGFELATQVFVDGSTLHRALGIGLKAYRAYLRPSFEAMIDKDLSVVAMDTQTAQMVGCLILTPFDPVPVSDVSSSDQFAPLRAITSELVSNYSSKWHLKHGDGVLVDMGVVAPEATGQGVYKAMRHTADQVSTERGFSLILGELSSEATQHVVLGQMGHERMAEVQFDTFEFEGMRPFESIKRPQSLVLSEGRLR